LLSRWPRDSARGWRSARLKLERETAPTAYQAADAAPDRTREALSEPYTATDAAEALG